MKSRHTQKQSSSSETKNSTTNQDESSSADSDAEEKAALRHFDANYDDSSDEESVTAALEDYDIVTSWKKFSVSHKKSQKKFLDDKMLSFAAHAAGLKLLYSKEVNAVYYPNKAKLLRDPANKPSQQITNLMHIAIKETLDATLEKLKEFINVADPDLSILVIQKYKKNITKACLDKLNYIVADSTGLFISELKAQKNGKQDAGMAALIAQMTSIFTDVVVKHVETVNEKVDREKTQQLLCKFAREEINNLFKNLKFHKLKDNAGKEEALKLLGKYRGNFSNLVEQICLMLETSSSKGRMDNIILHQITEKQDEILEAYLTDLKEINQLNIKAKYKAEILALKRFFILAEDNLRAEMSHYFVKYLQQNIDTAIDSFYRPVLAPDRILSSSNPVSFYGNFRLAKRNQERHTANLREAIFENNVEACTWSMVKTNYVGVGAVEMKEILNASFGRRDMVAAVGNYEKIYEALERIKTGGFIKDEEIDDKKIAQWLRMILHGEFPEIVAKQIDKIKIYQKLQSIAYLLFGCEAARNPAMIIVNQMLLDLIIDGDWNFTEALTGDDKRMPMAPEGAVAAARALEDEYRPFMPYPYLYRGPVDNKEKEFKKTDLMALEANIVEHWLVLQTGKSFKSLKPLRPQWLADQIEAHCHVWFETEIAREEKPKPALPQRSRHN